MVAAYVRHHEAHVAGATAPRSTRPDDTEAVIRRACTEAALVGATAAGISTGATVFAADSGGPGALIAIPVGGLAMVLDTLVRTLVHLRMTCDLARAFGVRFDPDDPWDVSYLHALVFRSEQPKKSDELGADLVTRLIGTETDDIEKTLGKQLLGEGVLRNIVPFVGVATSSVTSWRRTRRLGESALAYVRYRRALDDAFAAVRQIHSRSMELLVEGAWFLFTADGQINPEETATLARLLRNSPSVARKRLLGHLVGDESSWLSRLQEVPEEARDAFFHALEMLAAVDLSVSSAEWLLLRQAARELGRGLQRERVHTLMQRFRAEGAVRPPESVRQRIAEELAQPLEAERGTGGDTHADMGMA